MTAANLLVTGARLITCAPSDSGTPFYLEDAWMLVRDGVVHSIGAGTPPETDGDVLEADGRFVAPGFVSSHSHLFTSGLRGLAADLHLYGWAGAVIGACREATPDQIYWATLHGAFDFLNAGVTTAFDFTDPREAWSDIVDGKRSSATEALRPVEYILRQIDAKHDAGIRFVNATRPDSDVGTWDEILERFRPTVDYLKELDPALALGAAVTGGVQWADNPQAAEHEVALMREHGVVNQAHFLETPEALEHQRSKFAWYDEAGALGPDFTFGHFVHPDDHIIERVRQTGTNMSWQPTANGRLGSGVADIARYDRAGIEIGMGLDDQACSDLADPWQNMRIGAYAVRASNQDPTALTMRRVLEMHTIGSARVIGVADRVGSLEPGKYADFVLVDPTAPDVGPLWNPVDSYVLACGLRNLVGVYVGGLQVSDGRAPLSPLAARARERLRTDGPLPVGHLRQPWPNVL